MNPPRRTGRPKAVHTAFSIALLLSGMLFGEYLPRWAFFLMALVIMGAGVAGFLAAIRQGPTSR